MDKSTRTKALARTRHQSLVTSFDWKHCVVQGLQESQRFRSPILGDAYLLETRIDDQPLRCQLKQSPIFGDAY